MSIPLYFMRTIGARREPALLVHASGALLAEGARFSQTISQLAPSTFVPKGIYRFKSHEDANQHALDCLAKGILVISQRPR